MNKPNFIQPDPFKEDDDLKLDGETVQVVKFEQRVFHIYIDEEVKDPKEYRSAFNVIRNASPFDVINIIINTVGGDLSTALQFHNYLLQTHAETVAEVHCAYSSGSIIALSCDNIDVAMYGTMMIHSMSSGLMGKIHEMERYSAFIQKFSNTFLRELYDGFLTKEEIEEVIQGKDFWIDTKELKQRLSTWVPIRQRTQKITKKTGKGQNAK